MLLAGVGALAILTVPWGSSGAAPSPPNPAYFANDPRLAVCNAKASDAEAIFELKHLSDYAAQLPNAYPLVGLQADPSDPALVIVFSGQGSADREGGTPPPGSHDLCLVVGADAKHWQQLGIVAVDTTGLEAFKPEPTGTPIAADLLPWVNACGGASAGINRVLQLPHGSDAMTLNSVQVPISLMTDAPMTIVVYDAGHPFAPLGTPPAGAASVAPRQPGYQDLCILVGSDPATAVRTIVEVGPNGEITDAPSAAPSTEAGSPSVSPAQPTSDAPSGSVSPASPSGGAVQPSPSASTPGPSGDPSALPTTFSFDVENHATIGLVVAVVSDVAARLPGFEPGQLGTISIPLKTPTVGIHIEIQGRGDCTVLAAKSYPTAGFTLIIEDGPVAGTVSLSTRPGVAAVPIPLPSNTIVGCGG